LGGSKRVLEPLRLLRSHVDRVDLDTKYTFQEIPMRVVTDVRRQTEADLRTQLETYLMEMAALMEVLSPFILLFLRVEPRSSIKSCASTTFGQGNLGFPHSFITNLLKTSRTRR
jgi:hypothetical protein